jgi:putative protein kinase ArgK-like GTPase of G3E family
MTESKAMMGKRIGVFGKGGAGKSTVVVLLAHAFRDRGYDICVLDADSTGGANGNDYIVLLHDLLAVRGDLHTKM